MSLVVFPFKHEHPEVLLHNVRVAAAHPRVHEVLCIGYEREQTFEAVERAAPEISRATGTPVTVRLQERLGTMRPGKGDGMNTALRYFLEETQWERIHFYDADITSFGPDWITKAEEAADFGYGLVRHYFPRASTDAMITWMVTRTGFALLWPHTELSWIEQPLGGELLMRREVAAMLYQDERVRRQSDWGIDTLYTFVTVQQGVSIYECYIPEGKAHRLYGGLDDLRTMLVECFAVIQSLQHEVVGQPAIHRQEHPHRVPVHIAERVGYDVEATLHRLMQHWTPRQVELLELFTTPVREGLRTCQRRPAFNFMDEMAWAATYHVLLEHFQPGDPDWEELLFKLWTTRVLNYTMTVALRGYDYAQQYLYRMLGRYRYQAALENGRGHPVPPRAALSTA